MSELDKDSLELLKLAQESDEPSDADRERIRQRVLAHVAGAAATGVIVGSVAAAKGSMGAGGAAAASAAAGTSAAGAAVAAGAGAGAAGAVATGGAVVAAGGLVAKIVGVVLIASAAVGTGAVVVSKSHKAPEAEVAAAAHSVGTVNPMGTSRVAPSHGSFERATVAEESPAAAEPVPANIVAPAPPTAPLSRAATTPSAGPKAAQDPAPTPAPATTLQREVSLLRGAHVARERGDLETADHMLSAWEKEFSTKGSPLMEEALAERILLRCKKGENASADLARFAAAYPKSPLLERTQRACDAAR